MPAWSPRASSSPTWPPAAETATSSSRRMGESRSGESPVAVPPTRPVDPPRPAAPRRRAPVLLVDEQGEVELAVLEVGDQVL